MTKKKIIASERVSETNLTRYKKDLEKLIDEAVELSKFFSGKDTKSGFRLQYQGWYSESLALLNQILPDRLKDFQDYYKVDRRKEITADTYTLSDYLLGLTVTYLGKERFSSKNTAGTKFQQQVAILLSARRRFESSLFDIKAILQADLFDSELDIAKELNIKGFVRAGGAVCGVVLEKHLKNLCGMHKITIRKKDPTISFLNDELKNNEVYQIPTWRQIQHLCDLRNLCDHDKTREPTKDDVKELISGTEKTIKTIF